VTVETGLVRVAGGQERPGEDQEGRDEKEGREAVLGVPAPPAAGFDFNYGDKGRDNRGRPDASYHWHFSTLKLGASRPGL
jgi:hypothetical protein